MRPFRPTFWPTLIALPALIALIGLGVWQLERLDWKSDLIAERQARSQAPAVALPNPVGEVAGLVYMPLRVSGRFRHDLEFYLAARTHRGAVGLHVVTPLELDDGRVVLIDRGWIPPERRDPASRAAGQTPGRVEIVGLGRSGGWKGWALLRPENQPEENLWFWVDPAAMAAAAGLEGVIPDLYLEAGASPNPGGLPIGGQTRIEMPNDHLQYAITWFSLAVALVVIYLVYHLRPDPGKGAP